MVSGDTGIESLFTEISSCYFRDGRGGPTSAEANDRG